ncbi:MAG TPA: hypothetical protein VHP63_03900, partial [candidate division Zixibacteria bacterium]|nr:hypothetical protein [candidate division Zixibacteria bacterium]
MNKSLEDSPFYAPAIFGLMLLGILILFGEFIYSGKLLYGADTVTSELYHRTVFIEYFREHKEILQWDPYIFGGLPYVDSFQGDTFYPFSVLKFFLPLYFQLGFNLVLHIYLAGIFMFLAARQFGLGKTASLFSAASYMFAPCLISLVASGHDGNISVATLFPLVMLLLDRGFKSKPLLNFTLLGLMLGAIILTPHPRLAYFTLWAVALYTLYSLVETFISTRKLKVMIKPAAWVAYALTLALLLSAIQFYPGFLYTSKHSVRTQKESNWRWATSWSIHEDDVVSQLIPEFSGYTSKFNSNGNYWGRNAFKDSTETVGIVSLFLASIGLFFFRRKDAYFFGVLGLFAFTYALGETTPVFKLYYNLI